MHFEYDAVCAFKLTNPFSFVHPVPAQVIINSLSGSLPNAFSYTNDGATASTPALWCRAVKVAFSVNLDSMTYIDPDGENAFKFPEVSIQDVHHLINANNFTIIF